MAQRDNEGLQLRPARADESAMLTDLCLRSKAVWGYDNAFMQACRAELTLTPVDLQKTGVQVAERNGAVVGLAQVSVAGHEASLDKLFVEPSALHTGAGRRLFEWCVTIARAQGARMLAIESDPGAAAFYRRMGARDAGFVPSGSIPGRQLPLLKLEL